MDRLAGFVCRGRRPLCIAGAQGNAELASHGGREVPPDVREITMRRILFASTCIFALTAGARAQVAVIDPTGLVAQAKQLVETVKEETQGLRSYLTQLQQYSTELQTYATDAEMAANFIHSPSLGAAEPLLNLTGVNSAIPITPMSVISMVNGFGGGVTSLSGSIGKLQQLTSLTNSIAGTN